MSRRPVESSHGRGVFVLAPQSLPLGQASRLVSPDLWLLLRQATQARRCIEVEACFPR